MAHAVALDSTTMAPSVLLVAIFAGLLACARSQ